MAERALERILAVDDDPLIGAAASLALESGGGYLVEPCESGYAAIDIARRFRPDLVPIDVMIPDLDGPSTLAAFRRIDDLAGLPFVFMTGRTRPHDLARYRSLGARAVIAKPFDPAELARRVGAIWARCRAPDHRGGRA